MSHSSEELGQVSPRELASDDTHLPTRFLSLRSVVSEERDPSAGAAREALWRRYGLVLRSVMLLAALLLGASCKNKQSGPGDASQPPEKQMIDVRGQFEGELRKRGISFTRRSDGRYDLGEDGGWSKLVSIDNLTKNVERDHDAEEIGRFVDRLSLSPAAERTWEEARPFLRFSAEPNDYEFGDAVRSRVSPQVELVLTVTDQDERKISWVTHGMLKKWNVSRMDAERIAGENLDRMLDGIVLTVEQVGSMKLGMVPLESAYKASVIFAPGFRKFVEPQLGWPVLAMTPCRDFIFVFPNSDFELVGRSAASVLKEYDRSGYPITTEVWRVSDAGVNAIGSFREPKRNEP